MEITSLSLPGGTFSMGSPLADFHAEAPEHPITVSPFRLGATPITRAQFARFAPEIGDAGDQPMTGVSWYLARLFCHWVGGRLPTEAEWEYTARLAATPGTFGGDLFGRVSEWCLDWHGTYPPFHRTDPVGRWSGHARVCRGGSKEDGEDCRRPSYRDYLEPWKSMDSLGFRPSW